jgi:hypothetical protein
VGLKLTLHRPKGVDESWKTKGITQCTIAHISDLETLSSQLFDFGIDGATSNRFDEKTSCIRQVLSVWPSPLLGQIRRACTLSIACTAIRSTYCLLDVRLSFAGRVRVGVGLYRPNTTSCLTKSKRHAASPNCTYRSSHHSLDLESTGIQVHLFKFTSIPIYPLARNCTKGPSRSNPTNDLNSRSVHFPLDEAWQQVASSANRIS